MSKGCRQRRNKNIPSPQPNATSLTEENLRDLNKTLIGALKEKEAEISSLKENLEELSIANSRDRSHAIKCMESKDQTIANILHQKEYLAGKVEDMRCAYDNIKESSKTAETKLLHSICELEGRLDIVALEYTSALEGWNKEKGFLQGYIRQIYMERKKERETWEEQKMALDDSISRLQLSLKEWQEENERLSENLSMLRRNNEVLARNYMKVRDGNEKMDGDLTQARTTIQILFNALIKCRDDLAEEKKGREVCRDAISSMEADLRSLKNENMIIKTSFDKAKESGAWTGVLLDRQDSTVRHLKESLAEERSRLKDANTRVDKCLEQLEAERAKACILNADLRMTREKGARRLVEVEEELVLKKNEIEEIMRERNALKDDNAQAQGEMELLRGRHAQLQAENECLGKGYSNLQQDMTRRMMHIRKGIGLIKSI